MAAACMGLVSVSGVPSYAQESGIAWGYDKTHLFGAYMPTNFNSVPAYRGGNTSTVPVNQNEHLMVWMKPAAKPSFRKLWAIIHEPIAAGALVATPTHMLTAMLLTRRPSCCSISCRQ